MKLTRSKAIDKQSRGVGVLLLRSVIAINLVRFLLSFVPSFEGTAESPGFADRVFPIQVLGGFRIDGVWLVFSTGVIFLAMLYFFATMKNDPGAKLNGYTCLAWVIAFTVFVAKAFISVVIDFG